jgi:hypothetical protein
MRLQLSAAHRGLGRATFRAPVRPTPVAGEKVPPHLQLHRSLGNQGLQRLLETRAIQAKLAIGQPNDPYEQEADRVADQVMRMPAQGAEQGGTTCAACAGGASPCPKCAGRESLGIQRHAQHDGTGNEASVSDNFVNRLSFGRPLDAATRGFFESRFSQDFGQVRIHTDSGAAESARMLDARAYTAGPNVVFAAGEYAPHTGAGRRLLAHELTHVVQQQSAGPRLDRYTETTEANSRFWQGAAELLVGPLVRWTRGYFCLKQVFPPMKDLTFNHWIPDTCTARGGAGALHARDWDAFGHCWVACEGSRRCGNAATRDLGFLREVSRELGFGGPHDSFRQDVANQATGRELAYSSGRCYTLCDTAYRTGGFDLTAPTRTCVDCSNPGGGESAANCP